MICREEALIGMKQGYNPPVIFLRKCQPPLHKGALPSGKLFCGRMISAPTVGKEAFLRRKNHHAIITKTMLAA